MTEWAKTDLRAIIPTLLTSGETEATITFNMKSGWVVEVQMIITKIRNPNGEIIRDTLQFDIDVPLPGSDDGT